MLLGLVGKLVGRCCSISLLLLLATDLLFLLQVVGMLVLGILNFLGVPSILGVIVLGLSDFSSLLGCPPPQHFPRPCAQL